jgi:ABC-type sugar transport system permease subunit
MIETLGGDRPVARAGAGVRAGIPDRALPFLLLAPYTVLFLLFLAYPIGRAVYMSLFDWGIFGPQAWVGIGNYVALAEDARFWRALWTTLLYGAIYVPMAVVTSLLLAVLLHARLPGISLFRTVFFVPIVINVAAAAIAVGWVLDPAIGILNRLLALVGLPEQDWLNQPGWALLAVSLATLWTNAGFNIIILIAGLENIPDELYEQARIDGGTALDELIHITIPLLKPILLLVTVLSLVLSLQAFGEILLLTGGGPFGSTTVLGYLLYEEGFQNFAFGRATAIGVVMTVLIAGLSFLQFRAFRQRH